MYGTLCKAPNQDLSWLRPKSLITITRSQFEGFVDSGLEALDSRGLLRTSYLKMMFTSSLFHRWNNLSPIYMVFEYTPNCYVGGFWEICCTESRWFMALNRVEVHLLKCTKWQKKVWYYRLSWQTLVMKTGSSQLDNVSIHLGKLKGEHLCWIFLPQCMLTNSGFKRNTHKACGYLREKAGTQKNSLLKA